MDDRTKRSKIAQLLEREREKSSSLNRGDRISSPILTRSSLLKKINNLPYDPEEQYSLKYVEGF